VQLQTTRVAGAPDGLWLMPQLVAETRWLVDELPETAVPTDYHLGGQVQLAGYALAQSGDTWQVTLYWRALAPLDAYATVFVHALDENKEILAQSDAQPVQNSFPLPLWMTDVLVADTHTLPAVDAVLLGVGMYDPATFVNWSVTDGAGAAVADGRILLPVEVAP